MEASHSLKSFFVSTYVILLSEIGDRTFFVAALLAASHPRTLVYIGAMAAMITMTILSSLLGLGFNFIPRNVTLYLSAFLFLVFGAKMFKDGYEMSEDNAKEEYEEAQQSLSAKDIETGNASSLPKDSSKLASIKRFLGKIFNPVVVEAFTMCFLLEWGDKSQIATIILTSSYTITGVILGAIFGHSICTGFAVVAGRFVSYKIPVRWMTMLGGVTFLIFALHAAYEAINLDQEEMLKQIRKDFAPLVTSTNTTLSVNEMR